MTVDRPLTRRLDWTRKLTIESLPSNGASSTAQLVQLKRTVTKMLYFGPEAVLRRRY